MNSENENTSHVQVVSNVSNEVLFIGAIYSNTDFFIKYGKNVRSQYDFMDEAMKFLYDVGELMYTTYSQDFNENSINTFILQDDERKRIYREYGGWKTIKKAMEISDEKNIENYYSVLKKYSLLREYQRKNINITSVIQHKNFEKMDASHLTKMVRRLCDKISTVILCDRDSNDLVENSKERVLKYITAPSIGLMTPWADINKMTKGLQLKKAFCIGFLSNEGKTRCMMFLGIFVALMHSKKVLILSNEMDEESLFSATVTTIINSPEIRKKYNWNVSINEEDLTTGRYRDDNGNYIEREYDDEDRPLESDKEYQDRVEKESSQLRQVLKICEFVEDKFKNYILFKDVGDDYSDETLMYEIRKHNQIYGIQYFFYDTLKSTTTDWLEMKTTATKLREEVKSLDASIFFDFQLTDDAKEVSPLMLSSMNIANSKAIKHVVDFMFLGKELRTQDFWKYEYAVYDESWGDLDYKSLNPEKRYFILVTEKNRKGAKFPMLWEIDLDRNIWIDLGIVREREYEKKTTNGKKK